MDDFTIKPGVPNLYGLVQGEANKIEPGKRPLSSMSPTIVSKDGKPVMVVGTPGGSRIITAVMLTMINAIDYGMNATTTPVVHAMPAAPFLGAQRRHFLLAADRLMTGLERRSRVLRPQDRTLVAHHESGHALVACAIGTVAVLVQVLGIA